MKINHISWLIGASALAVLALIGFQVSWMRHSRELIEEQFNNRVRMALCATVEKMAENKSCSEELRACCSTGNDPGRRDNFDDLLKKPDMQRILTEALHFYQIDLPYDVLIGPKEDRPAYADLPYACSLNPILADDSHELQLEFKGKSEYYLQRMGLMVSASVGILGLISLVFGLGVYYLLRQKRLSDQNLDFFNHMTHEFRTPLTNIQLAGNMLLRKNQSLADNPYLGIIRREAGHLTQQVENVLYLAGIDKGEYPLNRTAVDLDQLIRDAVQQMDIRIQEKQATVTLPERRTPQIIHGDAFHLANAFRNLLDNALKYTDARPEIRIIFQSDSSGLRMRFADNGVGLSPQERRRVFQKFYRNNQTGEKGFGLGLAYVKKIMELHQGRVDICDTAEPGACFDLYFPAQTS